MQAVVWGHFLDQKCGHSNDCEAHYCVLYIITALSLHQRPIITPRSMEQGLVPSALIGYFMVRCYYIYESDKRAAMLEPNFFLLCLLLVSKYPDAPPAMDTHTVH